ncbi:MAG TPA: hypothetical protein VIO38_12570, partial [Rariglobus sp.]
GTTQAIWAVQDKIALNPDEEKTLELKGEMLKGTERTVWNPALSIPETEFELTDVEVARIRAAIEVWEGYGAAADRH